MFTRLIRRGRTLALAGLGATFAAGAGGCAALTNPTSFEAVPVHRLPAEVFGQPRENLKNIPYTALRQTPVDTYLLDADDVLGVIIDGFLGKAGEAVPVSFPQPIVQAGYTAQQPPVVGYPVPINSDGTLTLPGLNDSLPVRGKGVKQVQDEVRATYRKADLIGENARVLITLAKKRTFRILVVRQDSGSLQVGGNGQLANSRRGTGTVLDLPPGENDVLTAIASSGGLPGLDANNSVIIQRGLPKEKLAAMEGPLDRTDPLAGTLITRLPLRLRQGESLPFKNEDVILKTGDIVFIESRDTELFYTGGLLPTGEYVIPRDYDLDVLEAVAQVRGPLANGGVNFNNLSGSILNNGLGNPSPSLLTVIRKTPGGRQIAIRVSLNRALIDPRERILVQPGDFLILQETTGEALARYLTQQIRYNFLGTVIRQRDLTATTNINLP